MRATLLPLLALPLLACAGGLGSAPTSACRSAEVEYAVHEGANGDGFISIGGVVAGVDGTVYVLDAGESKLIAFDPDGIELWRAGGEGSGAGEFLNAGGVFRVGELIAVGDWGNRRLSFWTEQGEHAGDLPVEVSPMGDSPVWFAPLARGRAAVALLPGPEWDEPGAPEGALAITQAEGAHLDTVTTFAIPIPRQLQLQNYSIPVDPPYAPRASFAVTSDGVLAMANGAEYRVALFDPRGRLHAEIRGAEQSPAVTAKEKRAFARLLPDTLLVSQLDFPPHLPPITALGSTADGHVLVRTSWEAKGKVRWDRWSAEGEFVDSFLLPAAARDVSGAGNLIYSRAEDEVGASFLEVYRLGAEATCPGPAAAGSSTQ